MCVGGREGGGGTQQGKSRLTGWVCVSDRAFILKKRGMNEAR